jgi:hypothetical protein
MSAIAILPAKTHRDPDLPGVRTCTRIDPRTLRRDRHAPEQPAPKVPTMSNGNILEIMHLKKVYPFAKAHLHRFVAHSRLSVMQISVFDERCDERVVTADIRHGRMPAKQPVSCRFRLQRTP